MDLGQKEAGLEQTHPPGHRDYVLYPVRLESLDEK